LLESYASNDDSVTYWFPWKHPMARRRGFKFGVFDLTPPKWARRSVLFPPQNCNSQRIGSALRASPFASSGSLHENTTQMWALTFEASQMHQAPIFCPFDVCLAVSDMLRSTPTTPSVAIQFVNMCFFMCSHVTFEVIVLFMLHCSIYSNDCVFLFVAII